MQFCGNAGDLWRSMRLLGVGRATICSLARRVTISINIIRTSSAPKAPQQTGFKLKGLQENIKTVSHNVDCLKKAFEFIQKCLVFKYSAECWYAIYYGYIRKKNSKAKEITHVGKQSISSFLMTISCYDYKLRCIFFIMT